MRQLLLIIWLGLTTILGYAQEASSPLPPEQAFAFSIHQKNQALIAKWDIAPGYYLYRKQVRIAASSDSEIKIGKVILPQGINKKDILHGPYQAYVGSLEVVVPLLNPTKGRLNLNIRYQGCSSKGFCYAPISKNFKANFSDAFAINLTQYIQTPKSEALPEQDGISKLLNGQSLFVTVLSFLGLGLLLAFTPCVLPMIPILSGIIIGHRKKVNKAKAFGLSLAYVSGMALTYAVAGIVIALLGSSIQAELQRPWVIVLFSGVFILLALSLFGFYEFQLPNVLRQRINAWSEKQKGGTYLGVFLMGSLSTLIVSPCVSAPLVGVLAYIGHTGDVTLGAVSLLALGVGMGIPLLLIGLSAHKILPRAGHWMLLIERLFGIMMLGIAIWMLSRMIPGPVTLFLWASLCIFVAIFLEIFSPFSNGSGWVVRIISLFVLLYGIILMIGSVMGNSDPLNPWEHAGAGTSTFQDAKTSPFLVLRNMTQFNQELVLAQQRKQRVILDFYADWCSSCITMDRRVFSQPKVQKALTSYKWLRADVTANNVFDQALSKRFQVIGPPTILFFNGNTELTSQRIVGEVNAKEFLTRIKGS